MRLEVPVRVVDDECSDVVLREAWNAPKYESIYRRCGH